MTPRPQLARDPKFEEISPDVGELDDDAFADLAANDPDHALSLLAQMRSATDRTLAMLAARLAGRLVLDVAKTGPVRARGVGSMVSSPADRVEGDIDIDASIDALLHARAAGEAVDAADLRVRHWTQPATALCLVIDRSGSMSGKRLATAAVAAAACAHRAPSDWSVLAFADRVIAGQKPGRFTLITRGGRRFAPTPGPGHDRSCRSARGLSPPTRPFASKTSGNDPDVGLSPHDRGRRAASRTAPR